MSPLSGFGCWASDSVFPSPDLSSGLSPFIQKNHANQQKNIWTKLSMEKKYWRGLCIDFLSKLYDEFKQIKMNF